MMYPGVPMFCSKSSSASKVRPANYKPDETISFLDAREIDTILKVPDLTKIDGLRDSAIMETLFSTGMRIAELISLDVDRLSPLRRAGCALRVAPQCASWLDVLSRRGSRNVGVTPSGGAHCQDQTPALRRLGFANPSISAPRRPDPRPDR
jgi:Phage integrase family